MRVVTNDDARTKEIANNFERYYGKFDKAKTVRINIASHARCFGGVELSIPADMSDEEIINFVHGELEFSDYFIDEDMDLEQDISYVENLGSMAVEDDEGDTMIEDLKEDEDDGFVAVDVSAHELEAELSELSSLAYAACHRFDGEETDLDELMRCVRCIAKLKDSLNKLDTSVLMHLLGRSRQSYNEKLDKTQGLLEA